MLPVGGESATGASQHIAAFAPNDGSANNGFGRSANTYPRLRDYDTPVSFATQHTDGLAQPIPHQLAPQSHQHQQESSHAHGNNGYAIQVGIPTTFDHNPWVPAADQRQAWTELARSGAPVLDVNSPFIAHGGGVGLAPLAPLVTAPADTPGTRTATNDISHASGAAQRSIRDAESLVPGPWGRGSAGLTNGPFNTIEAHAGGYGPAPTANQPDTEPAPETPLDQAIRLSGSLQTESGQVLYGPNTLNPGEESLQPQVQPRVVTSQAEPFPAAGNGTVARPPAVRLHIPNALPPGTPTEMRPANMTWWAGQPAPEAVAMAAAAGLSAATMETVNSFLGPVGNTAGMITAFENNNQLDIPPGAMDYTENTPSSSDSSLTDLDAEPAPESVPPPAPDATVNQPLTVADEIEIASIMANGTLNPAVLRGAFAPSANRPIQEPAFPSRLREAFHQQDGHTLHHVQQGEPSGSFNAGQLGESKTTGQVTSSNGLNVQQSGVTGFTPGDIRQFRLENAQLSAVSTGGSGGGSGVTWATQTLPPTLAYRTFKHSYEVRNPKGFGKRPRTVIPKSLTPGPTSVAASQHSSGASADNGGSGSEGASGTSATSIMIITPHEPDVMNNEPSPGSSADAEGSTDDEWYAAQNFRSFHALILDSATPMSPAAVTQAAPKNRRKAVVLSPEHVLALAKDYGLLLSPDSSKVTNIHPTTSAKVKLSPPLPGLT